MNLTLRLNEAGNAALTFMLLFSMGYLYSFLLRRWAEGEDIFHNYADKAAVGIATAFTGFMLKSAAGWFALHQMNGTGRPVNSLWISVLFVTGTGIGLWGVTCTIRALSPYEWRRYTWLLLVGCSIAFAVIFMFLF